MVLDQARANGVEVWNYNVLDTFLGLMRYSSILSGRIDI